MQGPGAGFVHGQPKKLQLWKLLDLIGGWYRVRTCDPCRVKAVLYR